MYIGRTTTDNRCSRRAFVRNFIFLGCAFPVVPASAPQVRPPHVRRIGFFSGAGLPPTLLAQAERVLP